MGSSDSKLDILAEKAAKNAMKNMSGAFAEIPDLGGVAISDRDAFDFSPPEDGEEAAAFDLFDYCDALAKKNHQVQYTIKRNGEMTAIKYHPYSWEQLQKEFKGGLYQVTAKSLTTKRYLKSESRTLSDPPKGSMQDEDYESIRMMTPPPPPPPQGPSFMEIFTLMNSMNEKQRQEARENAKEQAMSSQMTMTAFVEMMKSQSMQSQSMVLEIAKMTQAISEKMADSQRQLIEKMESRFEKVVERLATENGGKKKGDIDMFEVMKLQQESYDRGFALANQTNQIAEIKAQEKLEMLEEIRDARGDGEPKEKESITDTLIKTMLPAVSQAMLAQTGQMAVPPPPQRRALQPKQAKPQQTARVQPPSRAVQGKQGETKTENKQTKPSKQPVVTRVDLDAFAAPKKVEAELVNEKTEENVNYTITLDTKSKKEWFEELLAPVIGQCLLDLKETKDAAEIIKQKIESAGETVKGFTTAFSRADMVGIVTKYGLPDEATPWFEETYAHIVNTAGMDDR